MTKNKITLALIGRGHWGQVYKKTIDHIHNIQLPNENIFGRNYKDILKRPTNSIDGVIVAVTTASHFEVTTFLLQHGYNQLLIEKPLTQTLTQAKKLQELVKSIPEAQIMVGHILLYDPAYNIIKKLVQNNLGKMKQITYTSLKGSPVREGTILQDGSPHPIYLFKDITGTNPLTISAETTIYDNIKLTLKFDHNLTGIANIGTIYPERKRELLVVGSKGKLILNEFMNPRKLLFIDFDKNSQKSLNFSTNQTTLEQEILEFADCINQKKPPKTPLSQGIDVVKIIELAEKSFNKKGVPILFETGV